MKRRFVECAVLLGIVMSVMFLAQTQNGISHELPHTPHSHPLPACRGYTIGEMKGDSGQCGLGTGGEGMSAWSWRSYSYGGRLSGTQLCYLTFALKVYGSASAGRESCSASIVPSISEGLSALKIIKDGTLPSFQGRGDIRLSISGVCYHRWTWHHGGPTNAVYNSQCPRCPFHCIEDYESGRSKAIYNAEIAIDILAKSDSESQQKSFKITLTGGNVGAETGYTTSNTETTHDYKTQAYQIDLELGDGKGWTDIIDLSNITIYGNDVIEKQSKTAQSRGVMENGCVKFLAKYAQKTCRSDLRIAN